ncbi:hypothetical protein Pmani_022945 [Petrolisthes manimaculis]|uniref:Isotocin-neurophysin IT 1-like n=1 Tax=Petrolisthes manimaculis TaxID=1843537 RepID=A0AAE1PDB0_9EUCA|nr:hypothetical protein Pmani_022945 [Petrolisthes manimaculis]
MVVVMMVGNVTSCFITNCPPGGKRSGPTSTTLGRSRTCTSCGPGLLGRCLGPDICCGGRIGCFLGTRETWRCRAENLIPVTCTNGDLRICGIGRGGRCAAPGLCCTEVKCEVDETCVAETRGHQDASEEGVDEDTNSNTRSQKDHRQRLALMPPFPSNDLWEGL